MQGSRAPGYESLLLTSPCSGLIPASQAQPRSLSTDGHMRLCSSFQVLLLGVPGSAGQRSLVVELGDVVAQEHLLLRACLGDGHEIDDPPTGAVPAHGQGYGWGEKEGNEGSVNHPLGGGGLLPLHLPHTLSQATVTPGQSRYRSW